MKPNAEQEREFTTELVKLEREVERGDERSKSDAKTWRNRKKKLLTRKEELLDLIEGREHIQPPLPMTTKSGKPEVVSLKWERRDLDLIAETSIGLYRISPAEGPGFTVTWAPKEGRSKKLDPAPTEAASKAVAQADWITKAGAQVLENSGSGGLLSESERKEAVKARKAKNGAAGAEVDVTPGRTLKARPPPKKGA